MPMTDLVLVQTHEAADGSLIGHLTLNSERSLNALSLAMVDALYAQLTAWQQDERIQCVLLDGTGDKAFCAGGDIRAMYDACVEKPGQRVAEVEEFFTKEYRLDHLIHVYQKPIVLWGSGIVMGGGVGLMAGASHRVVTETTRMAMPEVSIGLFPDVGGTYFLNRMPGQCGRFLGMTGYQMNAKDACYVGLADFAFGSDRRTQLLDDLKGLNWQSKQSSQQLVSQLLKGYQDLDSGKLPDTVLGAEQARIDGIFGGDSLDALVERVAQTTSDDKWLSRALATMLAGSPITWHLVWDQLKQSALNLEQVFQYELTLAVRCAEMGDFIEGVRALLIDKDRSPNWRFANAQSVPAAHIDAMVTPPWSSHPLQQLSKEA